MSHCPNIWFNIRYSVNDFTAGIIIATVGIRKDYGELPKKGLDNKTSLYSIKTLEDLGIKGTLLNLDKIKHDTTMKLARHIEHHESLDSRS